MGIIVVRGIGPEAILPQRVAWLGRLPFACGGLDEAKVQARQGIVLVSGVVDNASLFQCQGAVLLDLSAVLLDPLLVLDVRCGVVGGGFNAPLGLVSGAASSRRRQRTVALGCAGWPLQIVGADARRGELRADGGDGDGAGLVAGLRTVDRWLPLASIS